MTETQTADMAEPRANLTRSIIGRLLSLPILMMLLKLCGMANP